MFEQSRCSTSQFVPLQIGSNLKGVKQQISSCDWRYWLTLEMKENHTHNAWSWTISLVWRNTCNFYCTLGLSIHRPWQCFPMLPCHLAPSMCFYPRGCIKFNPDSYGHFDSKVPLANEHRNCWVDKVSYHIHLHSTDSDNTVLLSEKEHCTHGTLCSFRSVAIWVIAPL